ncbi:MAG: hypothetical protein OXI03_01530 [Chloroflexota bacterium]|nr:hypothetical protein [Chloroflexota bacterium]
MHASTAPGWSSRREIPPAQVETSAGVVDVHVRGGIVAGGAPPGAQFVIYRMRPTEVVVHRPDGRRERARVPDTGARTLRRMLVAGAVVALLSFIVERTLRT